MPSHLGRKLRHSDITEYRTFPDNFILTPHRSVPIGDQKLTRPANEHSNTCPVLKVAKQTTASTGTGNGTRWRLDSIPNLKGIPNGRMLPRLHLHVRLPSREDTFDTGKLKLFPCLGQVLYLRLKHVRKKYINHCRRCVGLYRNLF